MNEPLLTVTNLSKNFIIRKNFWGRPVQSLAAVDRVNFSLRRGETLGLVGETGCGKSTLGRIIIGLYQPTAGSVNFRGLDVHQTLKARPAQIRSKLQIIFQDPMAALNPQMTVGEIIAESLSAQPAATPALENRSVPDLLALVGLPAEQAGRFPHQLSGGQLQRIEIARTLAINPEFIVCDEPVSSLDVSVQAQIINLLQDLQKQFSLTYLFITHNLALVRHLCQRVAVMYLGSIVEIAPCRSLFTNPSHPYTQALLAAIPSADPRRERAKIKTRLTGEPASPLIRNDGCKFHSRCPQATNFCTAVQPPLYQIGENHFTACHWYKK